MAELLSLAGRPALSPFRVAKLLQSLSQAHSAHRVAAVSATYWHFVEVARRLDDDERATLERLLTYGPAAASAGAAGGATRLLVVPRPGTISPWSSKATDIAHNCGLTAVARIERGIVYRRRDERPRTAIRVRPRGAPAAACTTGWSKQCWTAWRTLRICSRTWRPGRS